MRYKVNYENQNEILEYITKNKIRIFVINEQKKYLGVEMTEEQKEDLSGLEGIVVKEDFKYDRE